MFKKWDAKHYTLYVALRCVANRLVKPSTKSSSHCPSAPKEKGQRDTGPPRATSWKEGGVHGSRLCIKLRAKRLLQLLCAPLNGTRCTPNDKKRERERQTHTEQKGLQKIPSHTVFCMNLSTSTSPSPPFAFRVACAQQSRTTPGKGHPDRPSDERITS